MPSCPGVRRVCPHVCPLLGSGLCPSPAPSTPHAAAKRSKSKGGTPTETSRAPGGLWKTVPAPWLGIQTPHWGPGSGPACLPLTSPKSPGLCKPHSEACAVPSPRPTPPTWLPGYPVPTRTRAPRGQDGHGFVVHCSTSCTQNHGWRVWAGI